MAYAPPPIPQPEWDNLIRYVGRLTSEDEALDIVQASYLVALQSSRVRIDFLWGVARNKIKEHARYKSRSLPLPPDISPQCTPAESWEAAHRELLCHELRNAVDQLPSATRDLIDDHFTTGLSQKQVAAKQGWSYAATRQTLTRAKQTLREMLMPLLLLVTLWVTMGWFLRRDDAPCSQAKEGELRVIGAQMDRFLVHFADDKPRPGDVGSDDLQERYLRHIEQMRPMLVNASEIQVIGRESNTGSTTARRRVDMVARWINTVVHEGAPQCGGRFPEIQIRLQRDHAPIYDAPVLSENETAGPMLTDLLAHDELPTSREKKYERYLNASVLVVPIPCDYK